MAKPVDKAALIKWLAATTSGVSEAQAKLHDFPRIAKDFGKGRKGDSVYDNYVICKTYLKGLGDCLTKVAKGYAKISGLMKSMDRKTHLYKLCVNACELAQDCLYKLSNAHQKMEKIVAKWLKVLKSVKQK